MRITRIVIVSIGLTLIGAAVAADPRWFDRHFLPSFFLPRHWYVVIYSCIRWSTVGLGLLLAVIAPFLPRPRTARGWALALYVALAAALAVGASELVLRRVDLRPKGWLVPEEEPRRRVDAQLGWTLEPSRTGYGTAPSPVAYAMDAAGYRVRSVAEPVDPDRPTILFIGESVMFGEGLPWQDSIPAQVGRMMGVQSANLAVHGFSTDQGYLRLARELPRFRRPVAVVSLFMTALFGRNLDDDRPHLGPGLVWLPPAPHARLTSLATLLVPYRRDETVEKGIAVTREVLRAEMALSQGRGARPLMAVPQLGAEDSLERTLRRRLLDDSGVPYVFIAVDGSWRLPWDRHPNARAAAKIAAAIAARLRGPFLP
jgi:hypothetical protein